ncbi:hypothetical protein DFJ73DRAFT_852788 [Zopfochytrium polystomum]|nr:hypothetical protein DFJ73DRAFT_852788 [Zopfochytrium polystomum]
MLSPPASPRRGQWKEAARLALAKERQVCSYVELERDTALDALKEMMEEMAALVASEQRERAQLEEKLSECRQALQDHQASEFAATSFANSLVDEVERLRAEHKMLTSMVCKNSVADAGVNTDGAGEQGAADRPDSQLRIAALEQELEEARESMEHLNVRCSMLKGQVGASEAARIALQGVIDRLESDLIAERANSSELQRKLETEETFSSVLKDDLDQLTLQRDRLQSVVATLEMREGILIAENSGLKHQLEIANFSAK